MFLAKLACLSKSIPITAAAFAVVKRFSNTLRIVLPVIMDVVLCSDRTSLDSRAGMSLRSIRQDATTTGTMPGAQLRGNMAC